MRQFSIILCLLIVLTVFAQQSNAGAIDFVDGADQSTEYTYDGNGLREAPEHQLERKSLTSDANKGISLIEYDDHNMPRRIQFSDGNAIELLQKKAPKREPSFVFIYPAPRTWSADSCIPALSPSSSSLSPCHHSSWRA